MSSLSTGSSRSNIDHNSSVWMDRLLNVYVRWNGVKGRRVNVEYSKFTSRRPSRYVAVCLKRSGVICWRGKSPVNGACQ